MSVYVDGTQVSTISVEIGWINDDPVKFAKVAFCVTDFSKYAMHGRTSECRRSSIRHNTATVFGIVELFSLYDSRSQIIRFYLCVHFQVSKMFLQSGHGHHLKF